MQFDETNPLIENDAQDEEFELGLVRKDLLLKQDKSPKNGSRPGAVLSEGGQSVNQTGGSEAEPSLKYTSLTLPKQAREQVQEQIRNRIQNRS